MDLDPSRPPERAARLAGGGDARLRAQSAARAALYLVRFAAPEFTSLCPVTGQPDFAHLVIDYAPGETIVESKSLKLFLGAFRNHRGFHEDVTVGIGQRLVAEMKPLLAPDRRLLVSARRHPDRRLLAIGRRRPKACGCPTRASPPYRGRG